MPGSTFGQLFKIHTFGESHGKAIGVIIDGCPAGLTIDENIINRALARRKPGQSKITTQRKEPDEAEILSGVFEGKTTGTPIQLIIYNKDQKSKDYSHIKDSYRPSHADYTWQQKFGIRDYRGGGRSSARETAARVAAGAIAQELLKTTGLSVQAYVSQVGHLKTGKKYTELDLTKIDNNILRCPDEIIAQQMISYINEIRKAGNTVGGCITGIIKGCPVGLGEPVFDKLQADLAKAMLSINAVKGFEYGSGFSATEMLGDQHNDAFENIDDKIVTTTNYSGGIQGGISNGMDIYFKVAFKPVATIMQNQESVNTSGEKVTVKGKGRHDPCVLPRAVPIVEAMAALVLVDHYLRSKSNRL